MFNKKLKRELHNRLFDLESRNDIWDKCIECDHVSVEGYKLPQEALLLKELMKMRICEDCGGLFCKDKMKKVINKSMSSWKPCKDCIGNEREILEDSLFYCINCKPPYDRVYDGKYYKRVEAQDIEVDKKGKKLK